jgi:cyclase
MLKVRLIPTLLYRDHGLVKGERFDSGRRIGSPLQAIKVYNLRQVDELVFLDIAATRDGREPDYALVDALADDCFMPLAVGGGIRSLQHVRRLLQVGADKVVIGSAASEVPGLVQEAAATFGSQCVMVAIDARALPGGGYETVIRSGTVPTGMDPVTAAQRAADAGAGEILLTAMDRDGTLAGYDLELIRQVSAAVTVPVIAAGGAGRYADFLAALSQGGAAAVAAAAMFHFTEQTPLEAKAFLATHGVHVRL